MKAREYSATSESAIELELLEAEDACTALHSLV